MLQISTDEELTRYRSGGIGFIYNDYASHGSWGAKYNVLHCSWCGWLATSNTRYPKYYFEELDEAISWLRTSRGEEGLAWKRCSCVGRNHSRPVEEVTGLGGRSPERSPITIDVPDDQGASGATHSRPSGKPPPWWVSGRPVSYSTSRERIWKEALCEGVPIANGESSDEGLVIAFSLDGAQEGSHASDLDNLGEPVLSVVVNGRRWCGGRRPNIQWLATSKRQGPPFGCSIDVGVQPPPSWVGDGELLIDDEYSGPLPISARSQEMADWIRQRVTGARSPRYTVAINFATVSVNLGDVATGVVKHILDSLWPLVGGTPGRPDDWRINRLLLRKGQRCVSKDALNIAVRTSLP